MSRPTVVTHSRPLVETVFRYPVRENSESSAATIVTGQRCHGSFTRPNTFHDTSTPAPRSSSGRAFRRAGLRHAHHRRQLDLGVEPEVTSGEDRIPGIRLVADFRKGTRPGRPNFDPRLKPLDLGGSRPRAVPAHPCVWSSWVIGAELRVGSECGSAATIGVGSRHRPRLSAGDLTLGTESIAGPPGHRRRSSPPSTR